MFKMRRTLYRVSYDKLIVFSIADCQGENSLKEPCAPIATSRSFPAELRLPRAHYKVKVKILVYENFNELISTSSYFI